MNQVTAIAEVENALVGLLKEAQVTDDVAPLTSEDIDESDAIVTSTPAIRVLFQSQQFTGSDALARLYETTQTFVVLCGAQDLRTRDAERTGAYELVTAVCARIAGARIEIASHPQKPLLRLQQVRLAQSNEQGTWYAVNLAVEHFDEYEGSGG